MHIWVYTGSAPTCEWVSWFVPAWEQALDASRVGMFSDVHKDSGSRALLQRSRLPDSVTLPREKEQRTCELATCLFRTV